MPETNFYKGEIFKLSEDILKKVQEILVTDLVVKKEEVTKDTSLSDLEVDSLDLIEIVMSLEMQFNICLDDEEIKQIKTVNDIVELIKIKI